MDECKILEDLRCAKVRPIDDLGSVLDHLGFGIRLLPLYRGWGHSLGRRAASRRGMINSALSYGSSDSLLALRRRHVSVEPPQVLLVLIIHDAEDVRNCSREI